MGWDDNGLPTERRVQNFFGVRCDPSLPYDPRFDSTRSSANRASWSPSRARTSSSCATGSRPRTSRRSRTCSAGTGLSVDWTQTYTTIGERSRRASQRAFLRLLARDLAYQAEAPTLWDVDYRTAVAQAELEDREIAGAYHRIRFARADGEGSVEIETTRPELIPACVALVAHPDDDRYRSDVGTTVVTPLFGVEVPVVAHQLADPEKGTGIAMICTFGDITDVTWWRELQLPTRVVIGRDGAVSPPRWGEPGWESRDAAAATAAQGELAGKTSKQAQATIVELLRASGELVGEPKPIRHAVKFYERGERPLEIVSSRQWFVKTIEFREELLERGRELRWHPEYMGAATSRGSRV